VTAVLGDLSAVTCNAREAAGISVEDAAEMVGISHVTWRRIERGQGVYGRTVEALEQFCGFPASDPRFAAELQEALRRGARDSATESSAVAYWRRRALTAETRLRRVADALIGIDQTEPKEQQ
jgi:transcriptional regulator with XRE-family HTH domain